MVDLTPYKEIVSRMNHDQLVELDRLIGAHLWLPLPGPQTAAYESEADELFFGGAAGGGKALSVDELIVTPFGFRRMGDIKVGDTVCAADGTPTKVIGVFPQGVRSLYRVSFQDGVSVLADKDHRWNYSISRKGKWRKSGREWKVGTTKQLAKMLGSGLSPLIPLCEPLKFTKGYKTPQRVIEPYALGLLLGDGYTKQNGPGAKWSFTTADKVLTEALPGEWVKDGDIGWRLRGQERPGLLAEIRRLGLEGCGAKTKFIPEPYKWAPVAERIAILQGLMDTDGTNDDRGHASFCSISKQLSNDVAWLVRSLGGRATITEKETTCELAYNVYIRAENSSNLFRLGRKRDRGTEYQHGKPKRRIDSIEYESDGEAVCIAVDHPSSLYVVGDGCVVTHNTDLILGTALTRHRKAIIFRREATQLQGILDRLHNELLKSREGYNGQDKIQRLPGGRQIEFGSCPNLGDEQKYQGRPHDLVCLDEITHFLPQQYRFLSGWLRTTTKGQRCRIIATGNPPTDSDGEWVIKHWAPWLDDLHPNPAKSGELRWYAVIDGVDKEVADGTPFKHRGEIIQPKSRTFISSKIQDNPFLMETGYMSQLQALPEPLRSQMLKGDFKAGLGDDPWQVIPTAWVKEAQDRWTVNGRKNPMDSLGLDPSRGGGDTTNIARRHGMWFDEIIQYPGQAVPDGPTCAALALGAVRNSAPIHVDIIGIGSSVYDHLHGNNLQTIAINSAEGTTEMDITQKLRFRNMRALLYWRMREALEPKNNTMIALPPDAELRADLCAPRWKLTAGGILIESKEDIRKRIGRSTGKGDACVYALVATPKRSFSPVLYAGAYVPLDAEVGY